LDNEEKLHRQQLEKFESELKQYKMETFIATRFNDILKPVIK